MTSIPHLVETDWLLENMTNEKLVIVDASWHMPNLNRNAFDEFRQKHIDQAVFFDIDEIADTDCNLPHMLPKETVFDQGMDNLGITNDSHIIVYDSYGFLSCARFWWTLKIMGHQNTSILNGGLKKWLNEGKLVTSDDSNIIKTNGYSAKINQRLVKSIEQIHDHIEKNDMQIIDARSAGRFAGKDPEPREGLSSGHMPNGFNLPFNTLSDANGCLKDKAEIKQLFINAGVDLTKPITTTCGSGITAANLYFAMDYIGVKNLSLFDGSWTEYAANINSVIIRDIK